MLLFPLAIFVCLCHVLSDMIYCPVQTYNGAIAVDPWKKPCGTLLEAAKAKGMRTGIVVTSRLSHATPGHSHFPSSPSLFSSFDIFFSGIFCTFCKS
jgi:hypothetical protein